MSTSQEIIDGQTPVKEVPSPQPREINLMGDDFERHIRPYLNWAGKLSDEELFEKAEKHESIGRLLAENLGKIEMSDAALGFLVPLFGDISSPVATAFISYKSETCPTAVGRMFVSSGTDTLIGLAATVTGPADIFIDYAFKAIRRNTNVIIEVYYSILRELKTRYNSALEAGNTDQALKYLSQLERHEQGYIDISTEMGRALNNRNKDVAKTQFGVRTGLARFFGGK